jgi:hypothetical protein
MNPLHMPSIAPRSYLGPKRRDRAHIAIVGVGGNSVRGGALGERTETRGRGVGRGLGRARCATMRGVATHGARGDPPGYKSVTTWLQVGHHLARLQGVDGRSTGP